MKDFAIEWYKERAKQPKYQSQVNESNLANITDQINRAEYVEPSKFYSNPNVYKGKVGNVAQVAMRQNKGAAHIQCSILWKISPYMKSDEFEVTIGNLREYQE